MKQVFVFTLVLLLNVLTLPSKNAYPQQTIFSPFQSDNSGLTRKQVLSYGPNQSLFEKIYFIDQLYELSYIEPNYKGIGLEGVIVEIPEYISDEQFSADIARLNAQTASASAKLDKQQQGDYIAGTMERHDPNLMNYVMGHTSAINDSCHKSFPFCTGTNYNFPAGVNSGSGQSGPAYGCLATTPNPAWYHMKIGTSGNIIITMQSTPLRDIDFICWGPFTHPIEPCVAQLTANKIVSCSYLPDPTEFCTIPNAVTGEFYILLITNFSNQPCNISFSQTGGTGATDCTIVPPPINNNGPLCVGDNLQLTVQNPIAGSTYAWSGPNNWTSTQQNPVIPNVNLSHAGTYTLVITLFGQTSEPISTLVEIYPPPNPTVTGQAFPCQGASHPYSVQFPQQGSTFQWVANGGQVVAGQGTATATIQWTASGLGSVRVTENSLYCDPVLSPPLNVSIAPLPAVPAKPAGITDVCEGSTGVQYSTTGAANAIGYIWSLQPSGAGTITGIGLTAIVDFSAGFAGTANISVTGSNLCGQGQSSESLQVNVSSNPAANAGANFSIPHGTSTTLQGSASGGSQPYAYSWSPADKLINPHVANPQTVNLFQTTVFTLTVLTADNCTDTDQVVVTITGGALGVSLVANPGHVCPGSPSELHAYPSGGSGNYTYSWTSSPAGFTSNLQNPIAEPVQTTTYYVSVNDGFNTVSDQITVTVWHLPLAYAGSDQNIPHGTSTSLNGTATGGLSPYSYSWTPAEYLLNPSVSNPQTVNLYQSRTFYLQVSDFNACVGIMDSVRINVIGDALAASPSASPGKICPGNPTQLFANPTGGSGNYTFQWTSNPPGFSSVLENPIVTPEGETTYHVALHDGYNSVSGQVFVDIAELPVPFFTSDTVCLGEPTALFDSSTIAEGSIQELTWYYEGYDIGAGTEVMFVFPEHGHHQVTLVTISDFGCATEVTLPVFVKQPPVIDIARRIPEDLRFFSPDGDTLYFCVFNTVTLDAGNPDNPHQLFEWSVGSEADTLAIGALGIGYELQRHTVTVTDTVSGCVSSRTLFVEFSMAACEYSVHTPALGAYIKVYPNPAKSLLAIEYTHPGQEITMRILNIHGQQLLPVEIIRPGNGKLHYSDISGLKPGVYFTRFDTSEHIYTVKLIVSPN